MLWHIPKLVKSMFGMNSRKYWYLGLNEWLIDEGFIPSKSNQFFFLLSLHKWIFIKLVVYVGDKLFYGSNVTTLKEFNEK